MSHSCHTYVGCVVGQPKRELKGLLMSKLILMAAVVLGFGVTALAETAHADTRTPAEAKIEDQVFSANYLEQVDTEQQFMNSQREADQKRHQKFLNQINKVR